MTKTRRTTKKKSPEFRVVWKEGRSWQKSLHTFPTWDAAHNEVRRLYEAEGVTAYVEQVGKEV